MKKIKLINKLNKSYYDKSKPEITDKEYDNLKKQILILEDKFDFLNQNLSISNYRLQTIEKFKRTA